MTLAERVPNRDSTLPARVAFITWFYYEHIWVTDMKDFKNIKRHQGKTYLRPTAAQKRQGKKLIRLWAEEGTETFRKEYEQALVLMNAGINKQSAHTLNWLIMIYMRSPEFQKLGDTTKKVRERLLAHATLLHGTKPFKQIRVKDMRVLRDSIAHKPEAANARIKAMRQVYKWAIACDLSEINPAANVPYLKPNNPDGFYTWSEADIQQFQARHVMGTKAHLAQGLLIYTGVRRSDVVRLGPPMESNGILEFTEMKNRANAPKERRIPILQPLRKIIDATQTGPFIYLITQTGNAYTSNGFGNWFKRRCKEAGLPQCSAHGLRKAGAVRAAMAGATTRQLMAMFGWESAKQAERYTMKAERDRLAMENMHLLIK